MRKLLDCMLHSNVTMSVLLSNKFPLFSPSSRASSIAWGYLSSRESVKEWCHPYPLRPGSWRSPASHLCRGSSEPDPTKPTLLGWSPQPHPQRPLTPKTSNKFWFNKVPLSTCVCRRKGEAESIGEPGLNSQQVHPWFCGLPSTLGLCHHLFPSLQCWLAQRCQPASQI